MNYNVEEVSPVERKISISVPVEEVNAAISATVAIYRTSADFKGFRKGKVPSKMVEARFKHQIFEEATTDLVNMHINEIVSELGVQPLSRLDVDAGVLVRDEEFSYTIGFEVAPEFEIPNYKGLDVEQEKPEVDPKEIDAVIERIRENLAETVDITEDRTAQKGDTTIISFNAWEDGKPIDEIKASNFQLVLGEGQALEDFEEIVMKLKPGEKGEGDVSFPEDFINKDFAGKSVLMRVTLHAIKEKHLPEVDDDFAVKAGGFKTVEVLREAIENSYLESRRNLVKGAAQKDLVDGLLKQVEFDLPPALVEENIDRLVADFTQRLESQGKNIESLGKTPEEIREEQRSAAEHLVRTQLFLLAIATKEGMVVQNEDMEQYYQQEAIRTQQDPETVRRMYEDNNLVFALKDRLLADRAADLIYSSANITEVPAKGAEQAPKAEASAEAEGDLIMTKSGAPFKTEGAAKTRLNSLEGEGEIVEVEGGFAIKPAAK